MMPYLKGPPRVVENDSIGARAGGEWRWWLRSKMNLIDENRVAVLLWNVDSTAPASARPLGGECLSHGFNPYPTIFQVPERASFKPREICYPRPSKARKGRFELSDTNDLIVWYLLHGEDKRKDGRGDYGPL